MIRTLHIANYALIEALDHTWRPGMTAMTGETGSGKSIVLGALGLLLGNRADAQHVRDGAQKCVVEATFAPSHTGVANWLAEHGFDGLDSEHGTLRIRREVTATGRSRAFVQDTPAKVSDLAELGRMLVDLHGQDETRALMSREMRLKLLDDWGDHRSALSQYADAWSARVAAQQALHAVRKRMAGPGADLAYLDFQINELESLQLDDLDEQALEQEHALLSHASAVKMALLQAHASLDGDATPGDNVLTQIRQAETAVDDAAEHLEAATEWQSRLASVRIELADLAAELAQQEEVIEEDPSRLEALTDRLDALRRMVMKHQVRDAAELRTRLADLHAERAESTELEAKRAACEAELEAKTAQLEAAGATLNAVRQRTAMALCEAVRKDCQTLKMPHVDLAFAFELLSSSHWDELATHDVEILFSANPGASPAPLAQVASGGERSRLMLAMKAAKANAAHPASTIVLDEIDTGVSGEVASRMASLMAQMSQHQQVLTVTHLPQVAARADHHLEVRKTISGETTRTALSDLDARGRVEALARMLSGDIITDAALSNAETLLAQNDQSRPTEGKNGN